MTYRTHMHSKQGTVVTFGPTDKGETLDILRAALNSTDTEMITVTVVKGS